MIKSSKPITLAEVGEELSKLEEDKKIESALAYVKRFSKQKPAQVKTLYKALQDLGIMKLKEKHIVKIIDILPEDADDLRKIFVGEDVSLDQNEIDKILGVIKKR